MIDQTVFHWWKTAAYRHRSYAGPAIMVALVIPIAIAAVAFRDYWVGVLCVALAVAAIPPLCAPPPRVKLTKAGVEVAQRKAFVNTHIVFPAMMVIGAAGVTIQAVVGSPTGGDARLPYIAVAAWILAALTFRNAVVYRGKLVVDVEKISVPGRFSLSVDAVSPNLVQQRKLAFPYLELIDRTTSSKSQLIFPTMCYGLEANSLYSTVRHLSEVGAETRATYSPELIREMLLFTPDREVAVGESIEVRIVAQPTATTP